MFAYDQVKERPKLLLAMTGLTQAEFAQLLLPFHQAWEAHVKQAYVDREGRQRQYGGGKPEATLVSMEDTLLFILYYVKAYPLQEILACEFGMVQSTAHEWMHLLTEVLKKALDDDGYLPERDPQALAPVLTAVSTTVYGIDGTERRRQRPSDPVQQADYYSGKKKRIQSRILFLETSGRARGIIEVKPMSANGTTKRLLMKKTQHFPTTSLCIKAQAFKGMNQSMFRRFNPRKSPKAKNCLQSNTRRTALFPASALSLNISLLGLNDVILSKMSSEIPKRSMMISLWKLPADCTTFECTTGSLKTYLR